MHKYILIIITALNIYTQDRIISTSFAYTEILMSFGLVDQIAAVDHSSINLVQKAKDIGNSRRLSTEAILSLKPSIVIISESAGPDAVKKQLRQNKTIRLIELPDIASVEDLCEQINTIASVFKKEELAESLVTKIKRQFAEQAEKISKLQKKKRGLFIYARGSSLLFVAGKNSSASESLKYSGIINAVESFEGYKPLSPEAVISSNPDVIFMLRSGAQSIGGKNAVFKLPGVSHTNAAKTKSIELVDDITFLGIGPQTINEVERLYVKLYGN